MAVRTRPQPTNRRPIGRPLGAGPGRGTRPIEAESRKLVAVATAKPGEVVGPDGERKPVLPFKIGYVKSVEGRFINALVYGPFGHGKTTFAGSALDVPSMRDVVMIDADAGDMSLTSRRDLDVIRVNKWDTIARVLEFLVLHCHLRNRNDLEALLELEKKYKSEIVPISEQTTPVDPERTWFEEQRIRTGKPMDEPYIYRTVFIDTLSEVYKYLIYKFTGVDILKTKISDEIERMEEWQPAQELFRLFIRSFRDLELNVIFISAEAIEPEMKNKKRNPRAGQALPALAGQMATGVATFIDIVGYLVRDIGEDGAIKRYLYLGAGYEGWISKHRFENLPDLDYVENPTLASLIELARKDAEAHASQASAQPSGKSVTATSSKSGPTNGRSSARPAWQAGSSGRGAGRAVAVRRRG